MQSPASWPGKFPQLFAGKSNPPTREHYRAHPCNARHIDRYQRSGPARPGNVSQGRNCNRKRCYYREKYLTQTRPFHGKPG